jgi:TolB protein
LDSNSVNSSRRPRSASFALLVAATAGVFLFLSAFFQSDPSAQTDVRIGVQAKGTMKSPLQLARFRGDGPVGSLPSGGRAIARKDFELSGVFVVGDVEPLEGKPVADPSMTGTVRVEGRVEQGASASFFQFRGQAIDVGTGEMALDRTYPFTEASLRETMHRFVDDVLEALTGERGIAETKIAYVQQNGREKEICTMDYDGENARQVTHDRSLALSPTWAPWGTEIAFTTFKRGNPDLYLFDLTRGASYPFSTRPGLNTAPCYSPDGKWIAITLSRDGNSEVYLVSRDAQTAKRLTRNTVIDTSPSFSPSGREIVFTSNRTGSPQVFVMDAEGLNQRLLTIEGSYNDSPQWSPKGDRITYAARHDGIFDVIVMDATGSNPIQITSSAGHNENPHWSADGRKIVFSSSRDGKRQIFMMNADGSDVVRLTQGGENFNPSWGPRPKSRLTVRGEPSGRKAVGG